MKNTRNHLPSAGESPFTIFMRAVLILGFIGWVLESVLVGLIVGFLVRVRRDLVLPPRTPSVSTDRGTLV